MALVEEVIEPLKYQTLALKVSIHCEGCKRKVKRVLQSIDGVYKIAFDAQQHKVTITGNVDAETLIKKLLKNGKNAELWPEIKPPNPNPNPKSKKKKKSKSSQKPPESAENPESKPSAATGDDETPGENTELDSSKSDDSDEEPNNPSPPADNPPPLTPTPNGGAPASGGGKKKKKKKKKPHAPAPTAAGGGSGGDSKGPEITVVSSPHPPPLSPPHPRTYHVPSPQPVVSYSTASYFPATHYIPSSATATASYYAMMEPALEPAPREDSYSLFSEENANACRVM
ncbi:Copper chaperone domain-containing protein [Dioscorea alata]|uniref:Copper chaperone domain-containing protein n=1 Tax=Dioscorea alata TaxID=55571 RepID=A0ACB7VQ12_DIOAL|nr:Copper chaperone domain-containing protein [Dioscorea alata]